MNRLFQMSWRLSFLLLSWQTRFFIPVQLAGWPWEQGQWACYLTWIPLMLTVILGWKKEDWRALRRPLILLGLWLLITVLDLVLRPYFDLRLRAVTQWWVQIAILGLFGFVMIRRRVEREKMMTWVMIGLLPHIILALVQYAEQIVRGWAWLGIAPQDPKQLGVSVIEAGDQRMLRAYGGFPHPTIFGGWLAIAWIAALDLASRAKEKWRVCWWSLVGFGCVAATFLTFARAAWIAVAIGAVAWIVRDLLQKQERSDRIPFWWVIFSSASLVVVLVLGITQRQLVFSRVQLHERLEEKSITDRRESLQRGWKMIRTYPLIGTGPNAELLDLADSKQASQQPLESPHSALILFFINFGLIGVAGFLWMFRKSYRAWKIFIPFGAALLTLAILDHYLWSYWSGLSLVLIVGIFIFGKSTPMLVEDSTKRV